MRTASVCQHVPGAVRKDVAYVVDTVALGCSEILSYGDDNGSWGGHTKPRTKYKIEVSEQLGITSMRRYHLNDKGSPDPEGVYTHYRNYFQHSHTPELTEKGNRHSKRLGWKHAASSCRAVPFRRWH